MDEDEKFRRGLGLDGKFAEASKRWRIGAPPIVRRIPGPEEPDATKLIERREGDVVRAQADDKSLTAAIDRLRVVSPWNMPPTKKEVKQTLSSVRTARNAINTAINSITKAERRGAWYSSSRVEVPGVEDPIDDLGRTGDARHDPVPPLQVARDILDRFIQRVEDDIALTGTKAPVLKTADSLLKPLLEQADINMAEAAAVMRGKGVDISVPAVTARGHRLRKSNHQQPKRKRGAKRR